MQPEMKTPSTTPPRSYKVGCTTAPGEAWAYNAMRFPSVEVAEAYAIDLSGRWTALRAWEVHPSDDPVHYYDAARKLISE